MTEYDKNRIEMFIYECFILKLIKYESHNKVAKTGDNGNTQNGQGSPEITRL